MLFGSLKESLKIEGLLPERALIRLKRGGIALYRVRKIEKNVLLFQVKKKDLEKVFAIYPNVCYNNSASATYTVTKTGAVGLARAVNFFKNRMGVVLGLLAFGCITLAADNLVLGVELVGETAYRREVLKALDENGMRKYALYPEGREDLVTAKLLTLDGVEFCSVKKSGHWIRVELRGAPLATKTLQKGCMQAKHEGELVSLTVLRGTPLKKVGERVEVGDILVGDWFSPSEDEERISVEPIARAQIACVYARTYEGVGAEEAFAQAYLDLALTDATVTQKSVRETEGGVELTLSYLVTEEMNL